ncbi:class I SAM-dependent RNA methyltransferase [Candidatus Saccharibacteria bacterium oral taxon 488]|nr:class I SAM-dependent RNA methyltransferase [Candidatus Saccharibacteria bacterium oral taxon 488]
MRRQSFETLTLEKIVGGGQALGTLADGRKCFVWGGLPGETVTVRITKKKSHFVEAVVEEVISPIPDRVQPRDPDSYLSTSPWQIMPLEVEQTYKTQLIDDAFTLHNVTLPGEIEVYCDNVAYGYRNKVEFSWYSESVVSRAVSQKKSGIVSGPGLSSDDTRGIDADSDREESSIDTLDLAFFRRGSKGKIVVDGTSLARPEINNLARAIRDLLRHKRVAARQLKTLLVRCDQSGSCVWQLYVKDRLLEIITADEAAKLPAQGGEIIYSDPRSPASRITERLASFGNTTLTDTILGIPFRYACEGFFQVNIPVYEQALRDMREWVPYNKARQERQLDQLAAHDNTDSQQRAISQKKSGQLHVGPGLFSDDIRAVKLSTIDLYTGVGTIGLTIADSNVTLVEINADAVREMQRNITELGRTDARAVLAPSEQALDHITGKEIVIVDPPRAGLHTDVIATLLQQLPPRILYLSCNPVTQARDVALLQQHYRIAWHRGYNFFPRTPHSEHLVVLDKIS